MASLPIAMDPDHDGRLGRCRGERQNRNVASSLDRRCHLPLVFCAVTRDPPGNDFSPFGDEISEDSRVLIVDVHFLIGAESTHLASDERFFPSVGSWSFWPVHSFLLSLQSLLSLTGKGIRVGYSIFRKSVAITSIQLRFLPSAVFHCRCWRRPSTRRRWPD